MTTNRSIRIRTVALLGGGIIAGAIGASAFAAGAQSSSAPSTATTAPTSAAASSSASSSTTDTDGTKKQSTETTVTGATADSLKAAALKQVPGATIGTITTEDAAEGNGAAYEVHLSTSSGAKQTLLFKSDLTYLSTETRGGRDGHGDRGGRGSETAVTGANAATLKAAALQKVPGATVQSVTSDSGDAAYEVHLTKADGTEATVKFDKNLKFVAVETGRGK